MAQAQLDTSRLIFTKTASQRGRTLAVSPSNSDLQHLHYGRVRLDADSPRASFETGARETALLCMKGRCHVQVGTEAVDLGLYDGIYVPRGSFVEIETDTEVDLVEVAAEVSGDYPLQVVRYEEVKRTPSLKFTTGGEASRRDLNIIIGANVKAGRIVAGFTHSAPGNWTSWPPHEHTDMLEEVYVYFDMPAPAFGIQLVYTDRDRPEFVQVVREGDAVLMPAGYHPNVAAPGHKINFIWLMAARREVEDRRFGVVNVQPEFGDGGSGLEASRK
jgi:5-deoxy-glucuronate isomerase